MISFLMLVQAMIFTLETKEGLRTILYSHGVNACFGPEHLDREAIQKAKLLIVDGGLLKTGVKAGCCRGDRDGSAGQRSNCSDTIKQFCCCSEFSIFSGIWCES